MKSWVRCSSVMFPPPAKKISVIEAKIIAAYYHEVSSLVNSSLFPDCRNVGQL